jgi:hypothetical protein
MYHVAVRGGEGEQLPVALPAAEPEEHTLVDTLPRSAAFKVTLCVGEEVSVDALEADAAGVAEPTKLPKRGEEGEGGKVAESDGREGGGGNDGHGGARVDAEGRGAPRASPRRWRCGAPCARGCRRRGRKRAAARRWAGQQWRRLRRCGGCRRHG